MTDPQTSRFAPTPDGRWVLRVRCSCGASLDSRSMTPPAIDAAVEWFLASHPGNGDHAVEVEVRRHWARAANAAGEIRKTRVVTFTARMESLAAAHDRTVAPRRWHQETTWEDPLTGAILSYFRGDDGGKHELNTADGVLSVYPDGKTSTANRAKAIKAGVAAAQRGGSVLTLAIGELTTIGATNLEVEKYPAGKDPQ